MGVASHLGIDLREYDARIRTFIPDYEAMLQAAAATLRTAARTRAPFVVDLGIGTGALAEACLKTLPRARFAGIDEDEGMLAAARARLGPRLRSARHDARPPRGPAPGSSPPTTISRPRPASPRSIAPCGSRTSSAPTRPAKPARSCARG